MEVRRVSSPEELQEALRIRHTVFVEEQGVPLSEEQDALDASAVHLLAFVEGAPVGTARLVAAKVGRVAVLPDFRGRGVGVALMEALHALAGDEELYLDAQVGVIGFYERLGYAAEGPEFLDAGIRHRRMRR